MSLHRLLHWFTAAWSPWRFDFQCSDTLNRPIESRECAACGAIQTRRINNLRIGTHRA